MKKFLGFASLAVCAVAGGISIFTDALDKDWKELLDDVSNVEEWVGVSDD